MKVSSLVAPILIFAILALFSFASQAFGLEGFDTTHQVLSGELAKYVTDGGVRYAKWKQKPAPLTAYLASLAALSRSEYNALPENDRKALWINASNAFTIKLVLDHYPIAGKNPDYPADSFRQIPDAWERIQFKIGGQEVTLDEIEHNILRRDFHDARAHFAVVCAAKGSPRLPPHAFVGQEIDRQLEDCKNKFLSDEKNISINKSNTAVKVSRIFQWFALDFAPREWGKKFKGRLPSDEEVIVEYLTENGSPGLKQGLQGIREKSEQNKSSEFPISVEYEPFDWSLNDLH